MAKKCKKKTELPPHPPICGQIKTLPQIAQIGTDMKKIREIREICGREDDEKTQAVPRGLGALP